MSILAVIREEYQLYVGGSGLEYAGYNVPQVRVGYPAKGLLLVQADEAAPDEFCDEILAGSREICGSRPPFCCLSVYLSVCVQNKVMEPEIWDSDGCTTSDSSDLPDIVSSDEDFKSWFSPVEPPQLSYEVLIPKRWCYLRMSVLKRYCHIVKVQLLGPILFGRPHLDERYRNWATEAELVQYKHRDELRDLDLKALKIIDLLESAHRALLVYALKRPLLKQFVRVGENLDQCSTLEEAIQVVKQQTIFRDAWKMLAFGNKMQAAAVLALTGLHYFRHIKQYSIDHNDLFEQFEDHCFEEEERAKVFQEHWESDMKKQHYEAAVKSLNEAIRVCAFNHLLYEKRSYCYFQLCQYKKAWSDAKRCIVLRPHSIEGHYLFAGALCGKGWYTRALKANSLAIQVCQWKGLNVKGLMEQRELIQFEQLLSSEEQAIGKWEKDDPSLKEQSCDSESSTVEEVDEEDDVSSEDDDDVIPTVEFVDTWVKNAKDNMYPEKEQNQQAVHLDIPFLSLDFKASSSDSENDSEAKLNQRHESKMSPECDHSDSESKSSLKQNQCNSLEPGKLEKIADIFVTKTLPVPSEDLGEVTFLLPVKGACFSSVDHETVVSSPPMNPKKDMSPLSLFSVAHRPSYESDLVSEEMEETSSENKQHMLCVPKEVQQEQHSKLEMSSEVEERLLKCKLKEASQALMASHFRNAQENYLNALKLIKEKKVYNLTTMEYILIEYACGLSYLGNNLIQNILEAEQHFMKILEEFKEEDSRHFNCLSYYGLSRVYLKWNRYKEARSTLEKSLTLVESNLVPGLRMWPGTDTVIEETRDGVLKELLKSLLKECLCYPRPDAVCRYDLCYTHNKKRDIYAFDPDFKGFVRVHCNYDCRTEYHLYCWRQCKIKELQDRVEKDILGLGCLTPDCIGCIWKVDIFQDSQQKTIEFLKPKRNKTSYNQETKAASSSFNLKKITRKKERKYQNTGKQLSNIHQEQTDISNRKPDQNVMKDETVGARKKAGKTKDIALLNEWRKNDKIRNLKKTATEQNENSYAHSEMTDYYQWVSKKEKVQNSNASTYLDNDLQNINSPINLELRFNKKNKCKTKELGASQGKGEEHVTESTDCNLLLYKSLSPVNSPHSIWLAKEQASSDDSCSKSQSLKNSSGRAEHSIVNKKITMSDGAVLTDPIKPFESKERTFLQLYHENIHLKQNYEKSQKLYARLCDDTQSEIKIFKEKHEQLVFKEKKLRNELRTVKLQMKAEKEKNFDQRKYQLQELSTLQEELKSTKNNLERSKKATRENDTEVQKIKEERERWINDKKKLQTIYATRKEDCRQSASRLLSVETQIQEWKKYTRLYLLNQLLQEAVENMKFYAAHKSRYINSPDIIAICDMWEKRMKGIQEQIDLVNATSWSPEDGIYNDGAFSTNYFNFMPSQYKFKHQKYPVNQQRLSPSPVTVEMGQNVAESAWFSRRSKNIGLDAKTLLTAEKNNYRSAAWPRSYLTVPTMQPNSALDLLDLNQSDLELEFRMLAGQNMSFPLHLASGGLEMHDVSTEEKSSTIPDNSLGTLQTSHTSENLQHHLFEPSDLTAEPFNKPFKHLQSAHAIVKPKKDFQALHTQRPLAGASTTTKSPLGRGLSALAEPRLLYHAVMEQLFFKFPTINADVFHSLINKVKDENNGTLLGLSVIDLVRQVSHHVVQGTYREMTYPSASELFPFRSIDYENPFLPSYPTLQPDLSPARPDRFSGLMSASANPSCFESLPLGDLLELEGSFDGL
ncbi:uncharacterized protein LOC109927318 [Rhincodon typus]|uniref:uncharacterized protein LOC109927318 n=1 Tax=Rhincodon typus TaxID=259920 RepID=UPI002030AFAD|nr:uncharacterized protein LOC109927318 [Rhincodon typus]